MFLYKTEMRHLTEFHKQYDDDTIWWTGDIYRIGRMLFSFDKVHVYNLFTDWDELTEDQKEQFRRENPELLGLVGEEEPEEKETGVDMQ